MEHVVNLVQVYMRHEMSLYDFWNQPPRTDTHFPTENITVPLLASSISRAAKVAASGMDLNYGRQSSSRPFAASVVVTPSHLRDQKRKAGSR